MVSRVSGEGGLAPCGGGRGPSIVIGFVRTRRHTYLLLLQYCFFSLATSLHAFFFASYGPGFLVFFNHVFGYEHSRYAHGQIDGKRNNAIIVIKMGAFTLL